MRSKEEAHDYRYFPDPDLLPLEIEQSFVDSLKKIGAIFVEKLDEVKDKTRPVIFSAHGVPKSVPEKAKNLNMEYIDATCPLVSKVHKEAENLYKNNKKGTFKRTLKRDPLGQPKSWKNNLDGPPRHSYFGSKSDFVAKWASRTQF